jgi:hypothetical protein
MTTPLVLDLPIITVTPEGGAAVDLSCHIFREARNASTGTVDVGTWCSPGAQANGLTTFQAVWDFQITDDLDTVFAPLVGKVCDVVVTKDVDATDGIGYKVQPPYNPAFFGTWQVGARIESSMTMGILEAPHAVTVTP